MKEQKWQRRERKQHKRQHGMRVDGSSVRLLEQIKRDKAGRIRKERQDDQSYPSPPSGGPLFWLRYALYI